MYVSKELTHFVGREFTIKAREGLIGLRDAQELQYTTLSHKILGPSPQLKYSGKLGDAGRILQGRLGSVCDETMFKPPVVCFCDIPVEDLSIHMRKYSQFGLSYNKGFLASVGATPVFYVARGARGTEVEEIFMRSILPGMGMRGVPGPMGRSVRRSEVIDEVGKLIHETSKTLTRPDIATLIGSHAFTRLQCFRELLAGAFMCHVKCFDETVDDDADNNFYMEREWRVLEHVDFALTDVVRVVLPDTTWASRFERDHPDFQGHVTVVLPTIRCVRPCCASETRSMQA